LIFRIMSVKIITRMPTSVVSVIPVVISTLIPHNTVAITVEMLYRTMVMPGVIRTWIPTVRVVVKPTVIIPSPSNTEVIIEDIRVDASNGIISTTIRIRTTSEQKSQCSYDCVEN
jgi:hypothetical protein